jgi:hypothetical protein
MLEWTRQNTTSRVKAHLKTFFSIHQPLPDQQLPQSMPCFLLNGVVSCMACLFKGPPVTWDRVRRPAVGTSETCVFCKPTSFPCTVFEVAKVCVSNSTEHTAQRVQRACASELKSPTWLAVGLILGNSVSVVCCVVARHLHTPFSFARYYEVDPT